MRYVCEFDKPGFGVQRPWFDFDGDTTFEDAAASMRKQIEHQEFSHLVADPSMPVPDPSLSGTAI